MGQIIETDYPTPTERGLYLARSAKDYRWFNLVVEVDGESPFFYIRTMLNRTGPYLSKEVNPNDIVWGPKIEIPSVGE
jgi:hypothetical protein